MKNHQAVTQRTYRLRSGIPLVVTTDRSRTIAAASVAAAIAVARLGGRGVDNAARTIRRSWAIRVAALLAALVAGASAWAGDLSGKVVDASGAPVPNAVIVLTSGESAATTSKTVVNAIMDQRKLQFDPHVLVVQRGTPVRFPNSDDIRHQVYSFSDAKRFSLPLYHGVPAAPVVFDKAGEVVLGCNIHDRMLGYIYVVDSPWFAKADDQGALAITNVPAGTYVARLWYPGLLGKAAIEQPVQIAAAGTVAVTFNNAEREVLPESAPAAGSWSDRRKREP